ncbi:CbtA family protein [Halobacterium hubeiense]|uniref:CbtA family protein n=1 Tax=Halobacterium hubeiense TaxID=1407499 RepID=UPI003C72017E
MFAEYLTSGVKAGVVAGLVFGLFVAVAANPLVAYADEVNHGVETTHDHAAESGHGDAGHHESAVSATVTDAVSVLSGWLWAVLLGGVVFGAGYYFLEPAIPGTGATKSYVLAFAGFVTVSGAPWLVLPPVAPGAEQSLSVDARLPLYAGMMVAGALTCLLSGYAYDRLSATRGVLPAAAAAAVPFGLLALAPVVAPTNAVHGALPAALGAGLTGLFVFGQLLLWVLLAAAHARFAPATTDARSVAATGLDAVGAD